MRMIQRIKKWNPLIVTLLGAFIFGSGFLRVIEHAVFHNSGIELFGPPPMAGMTSICFMATGIALFILGRHYDRL